MSKLKANKQINGTFGTLWVNKEKWMDVESFEATVNFDFEDSNMCEDLATHKKLMGWNGEGTITVKKVYSRGAQLMGEAAKTGIIPDIELIGKLADPDAYGSERVSISEVTFNSMTLMKFEKKTKMEEELPFNFADYDFLDKIAG
ncbi:phage tail tube protein [Lysinibacillus fusiformis]|uniref:phage tail tube protein n=1 Tax=Lysinibacillus fusiformis TaxID=28031 RepID=UPI0019689198|nr:phage tail tube protein [Lysinibacillus fusiformis]QSB10444.1 phage tail tube protein [Lysinibacillus fusiformis]